MGFSFQWELVCYREHLDHSEALNRLLVANPWRVFSPKEQLWTIRPLSRKTAGWQGDLAPQEQLLIFFGTFTQAAVSRFSEAVFHQEQLWWQILGVCCP